MKHKHAQRTIAAFIATVLLAMACLFTLSACKKDATDLDPEDTVDSTSAEPAGDNGNVAVPELAVSFDETATYGTDAASLLEALDVSVVSDGLSRKVAFSIKSLEVTEDGQYVRVVIVAEELECAVLLPYAGEVPVIREDLKPLYEFLNKDGDKAYALHFAASASPDANSEAQFVSFGVIVNAFEDHFEFALTDAADENATSYMLFKDGTLTAGNREIPKDELTGLLLRLFGNEGIVAEDEAQMEDGFLSMLPDSNPLLTDVFVALSSALDACDNMFDNAVVKQMGIGFTHEDGVYTLRTNSKKIIQLIELFADNDTVNVDEFIDMLDAQSDGALKKGDVKIDVTLAIREDGLTFSLQLQNVKTEGNLSIEASLNVSHEAVTLPEVSALVIPDLVLTIPVTLPQSNVNMVLNAAARLSNILIGTGDYATITLAYNESENIAQFVLNDAYMYLDMSAWALLQGQTEESAAGYVFYHAFEIDGEPASLMDVLPLLISGTYFAHPENPNEGDDDEQDAGDPRFAYGYGCTVDGNLIFPIGVTENDVRAKLDVYTLDENDNLIPFDDYTIKGYDFNNEKSFRGEITIELAPGYQYYEDLVVYNPITVSELVATASGSPIPLGITAAEAVEYLFVEVTMWDYSNIWYVYDTDFAVIAVRVNGDFVPVNGEYVFETAGDYDIKVARTGKTEELSVSLHVYDPDHLQALEFLCADIVWVYEDTTEEEVREMLGAEVCYDNDCFEAVTDFEITGGYVYGAETIEVTWHGFTAQVELYYPEAGNSQGGSEPFDILNYLRSDVIDLTDEEEVAGQIRALLEENKELLRTVVTFDKETGLRVIINAADNRDLLAVVNLFFGIPTEDGYADIDEEALIAYLGKINFVDIPSMFNDLIGVEPSDFLTDLVLCANISLQNGLSGSIELNDGNETVYLATGFSIHFAEAAEPFVLDADVIAKANDFSDAAAFSVLSLLLSSITNYEDAAEG